MATINLLPWRDELRQEKKREFMTVLALVALVSVVIGYAWVTVTQSSIDDQKQRNRLLEDEIAVLDEKVKSIEGLKKRREELETRIRIIQDLQFKRPLVVHYFDEIVRAVPDGLYFDSINRSGDQFLIKGKTESTNRLSTLMRNLDGSRWFQTPNLKNMIAEEFELTVGSIAPEDQAEDADEDAIEG